jgi:hypothetical protein
MVEARVNRGNAVRGEVYHRPAPDAVRTMTSSTPDGCLHAIVLDAGLADESLRRGLGEVVIHRETDPLRGLAAACRLEIASREGAAWGLPPRGRVAIVLPEHATAGGGPAGGEAAIDCLKAAVRRHLPRIELWSVRQGSIEPIATADEPTGPSPTPASEASSPPTPPREGDRPSYGRTVTPEEIRMLLDAGDSPEPPRTWSGER